MFSPPAVPGRSTITARSSGGSTGALPRSMAASPIERWTPHDCRRVFRTGLSTLGVAPHVAELCLAHRQPGLARIYDLHRFEAEKRRALNAWAAHLLSIVEPVPGRVVQLRKKT